MPTDSTQTGSLVVRAYTSQAQLPVAGATVIITTRDEKGQHTVYSIQSTDQSGGTPPFQLSAPNLSLGLSPSEGQGEAPFTNYSLVVEHPDYFLATFEQLQVFPGVETVQNVPLVPLPQPSTGGSAEPIVVTPQDL